ncbi:MAG: formylglycine-generating enzyme family protein [Planctomycetaceae bacterium]
MADQPRQILCDLIQRFGPEVASDPKRCENLLKDLLRNGFKREVNALVSAVREGVPSELRQPSGGAPLPAVVVQQARKLHEDLGLDQTLAEWAVQSWAAALGINIPLAGRATPPTVSKTAGAATSPSGLDLANLVRSKAARLQNARDEAQRLTDEARRLVSKDHDYAAAAQLLAGVNESFRDQNFYQDVCRKRDRVLALEKHITTEVHADRFDWLAPTVREFLSLQPQRDDMQELLAALPKSVEDWTNAVGVRFKLIQPGNFLMGDNAGDYYEKPAHQVTITRPFYCGVFPVTQAEYRAVTGQTPSHFKGERRPVEQVSWDEATAFCAKLNQQNESRPPGMIYRLLSEAEWEYCCRAGTTTSWCCQSEAKLGEYAWFGANAGSETHDVGTKKANAWGLHDFHGNVWEWCLDWTGSYSGQAVNDPVNLVAASLRVYRGGGWSIGAAGCRSAFRRCYAPDGRSIDLGFRLALGPELK